MFWTATRRVLRSGFVSFYRNSVISIAAILVVTITLFVIGGLLMSRAVLGFSLNQIKDKVDVNVYFNVSAPEERILELKRSLEALPEVRSAEYISREQALAEFKARHESDYLTLQALDELGENPLGAVLNVKAKEPSQYESIAKFLGGYNALVPDAPNIIDKINYFQNKEIIERLTSIIAAGQKLGLAVTLILVAISVIIVFNTIRLIIYISREEISVMKLVGASDLYIRGPFMVEGVVYGLFATILTMAIYWPLTYWLGNNATNFLGGLNLYHYYLGNFFELLLVLLGAGSVLGVISSYLAVRKYLNLNT
ncbi:ABC transporter permease [Candidatus Parcubacteria bacterium]|nr:ABC transporter permease [Candidatus Parcubacteria bacterium]